MDSALLWMWTGYKSMKKVHGIQQQRTAVETCDTEEKVGLNDAVWKLK